MARITREATILDVASSTGAGTKIPVEDFRHCVFSFATDGGADADLTVQFQGAIEDADFDSAASVSNMWDYIQVTDLQDGSTINGDTGISVATADDYRLVEMNTNGLEYVTANLTARAEGEVTVKAIFFDEE